MPKIRTAVVFPAPLGPSSPQTRPAGASRFTASSASWSPYRRKPSLSVERIVAAAIALADREGLEAVSMRRVAQELGGGTMSLYRHVPIIGRIYEEGGYEEDPEAAFAFGLARVLDGIQAQVDLKSG